MSDLLSHFKALAQQLKAGESVDPVELLIQLMPDEKAEQLRLCAIPHHFSVRIIQVLCPTLDEPAAAELCSEFAKLAITSPVHELPDHYTLHDQARRHLFGKWLTPEYRPSFVEANQRLLAYRRTLPEVPTEDLRERLHREVVFHTIAVHEAEGISMFVETFRRYRNALRWNEADVLCRFVREFDPVLSPDHRATLGYCEGKLRSDQRQWSAAESLFDEVIQAPAASVELRVKANYRKAMVFVEQRRLVEAGQACRAAFELARNDPIGRKRLHRIQHEMSVIAREGGDCDGALSLLRQCIEGAMTQNDAADLATYYNSLGEIQKRLGEPERAFDAYKTSLGFLDATSDRFRRAQVLSNLGALQAEQADWAASETSFRQALGVQQAAGDLTGQAKTHNNLVRVLQNSGKADAAKQECDTAIRLFRELRDWYNAGVAQRNLARLYRLGRQHQLARVAFTGATTLFQQAGAAREVETTQLELRTLDRKIGLPWWAWTVIVLLTLVFALAGLSLVFEEEEADSGEFGWRSRSSTAPAVATLPLTPGRTHAARL